MRYLVIICLAMPLCGADLQIKPETRETLAENPPKAVVYQGTERVGTKRPVLLMALAESAAAVMDVEMTQHCIGTGKCYEANTFMPSNRAGQYGIKAGFIVASSFTALGLRRSDSKFLRRIWWIPQAVNVGASLYGFSTGLRYR